MKELGGHGWWWGNPLFSGSLCTSTFQAPRNLDPYPLVFSGLLFLLSWCSVFPITSSDLPDAFFSPSPPPTDYVYFENSSSNPYLVRRIEELNKVSGAEPHLCPVLPPHPPWGGCLFLLRSLTSGGSQGVGAGNQRDPKCPFIFIHSFIGCIQERFRELGGSITILSLGV